MGGWHRARAQGSAFGQGSLACCAWSPRWRWAGRCPCGSHTLAKSGLFVLSFLHLILKAVKTDNLTIF